MSDEIGDDFYRLWREFEEVKKKHVINTELQGSQMEFDPYQRDKIHDVIEDRGNYTISDIEKESGLSRDIVLFYLRDWLKKDFLTYHYQDGQLYFVWVAVCQGDD